MMGVSFARRVFIVFGNGASELPLVHVDNAVEAIVECINNKAANNQVFNVVDPEVITKRTYVERVVKRLYPSATVVYCPMSLLVAFTRIQESVATVLRTKPFLTAYRLVSSQRRITYSTAKIRGTLGWRPRPKFAEFSEQLPSVSSRRR
jgi:nucleoside-diphosphate-sugar epimerase